MRAGAMAIFMSGLAFGLLNPGQPGEDPVNQKSVRTDPSSHNQYDVAALGNAVPQEAAQPAREGVRFVGVLVPVRQVHASPRVAGQVAELLVEEGARVQAGQVLARLERTAYELKFRRAQALVERAKARLVEAEAG